MTNEQILKKVIEKAIKNGWDKKKADCWLANINSTTYIMDEGTGERDYDIEYYIFSHDFAKAFWKKDLENWAYHLKQMVLEKEPLLYLEKFL